MAEEGELKFGDVIQGTIDMVGKNIRPMALYVLLFSIVGTAIEWGLPAAIVQEDIADAVMDSGLFGAFGAAAILTGLLLFVIAVVAQYMLWAAVLRNEGLGDDPVDGRYLAFLGQAILAAIGTGFAMLLLILPAFFVMARWSIAPALLIGNNQGAIEALGNSWDAVRGNTTPVFLAILVGAIAIAGVGAVVGGVELFAGTTTGVLGLVAIALAQIVSNIGTVLVVGLGVFLFGYFYGNTEVLKEVFG